VVNHEPNVASETSQKVNQAIADLHYVPNVAARSLSRGKARAIGLVTGWPINTPYTSALIELCLKNSNQNCYSMVLFSLQKDISSKLADAYLGKQVDGIILDTNAAEDAQTIQQLDALSIPYVIIHPNHKDGHPNASFIEIDNVRSARQAVEYLIQLGHRAIGYIGNRTGLNFDLERLTGYHQALAQAGIPARAQWELSTPYPTDGFGFSGSLQLIHDHPELTAIFAATDDIALGTVSAVWQLGLKVPEDISVVGFDDIPYAVMIAPPLTTVHQPIDEMARIAVNHLISLIENPETQHIDLILPTQLIIRETCKPPRSEPIRISISP
jgi:DNA-binding LacI/PurR family transcriptional regulator